MPERHVKITTPDGVMETFVAHPPGKGPFPAVVLLQHLGGVSESMKLMARRVASEGYVCALPALYYRLGSIVVDPLDPDERIATIREVARGSLLPHAVMWDIQAVLRFLDRDPRVRPGPKALLSYGATGGLTLLAAASFPATFRAAAVVLGTGFFTDRRDSPHLMFGGIRSKIYLGFCAVDPVIPPPDPDRLLDSLRQHGVDVQAAFHPDVVHGYPFPNRPAYDRTAAERDWESILSLYRQQIG